MARARIRTMKPEDTSCVFDNWLKSWRTNRNSGVFRNKDYYQMQRAVIEELVGKGAEIYIACNENNEDHIFGWACFDTTPDGYSVIHYLYVKDPFLGYNIEFDLLNYLKGQKPGFYTFNYPQVVKVLSARWPGVKWQWAPEIARRKQVEDESNPRSK